MSQNGSKRLNILFVAAEAAPYAKVGGLGEVMRSLPAAMRRLHCDVRIFVPKYATIDTTQFPMRLAMKKLRIATKEEDPHGLFASNVLRHTAKGQPVAYFLENMECFEKRANVYGYADDTMRWLLFSRGVLEFVIRSPWKPDVIIANDWETGFVPNLLKTEYRDRPELAHITTIFCIHNLRNQGMFDAAFVSEMDADFGRVALPLLTDPGVKKLNGMRRGILSADHVVTVSPTYAKEILTPEFGEKLDELLRERRGDLTGILNGINYDRMNPETDPDIPFRYTRANIAERAKNKAALQERFGLAVDEHATVLGIASRLDEQKGFSLLLQTIRPLLDNLNIQLIVIGTGEKQFKIFFKELADAYPTRVGVYLDYDEKLPHLLYAGADVVLIPSRFEPSGLVQMEAMRYGAIPIARKTGGLADTVFDYRPHEHAGTGFVFEAYEPYAFLVAVVRAYEASRNRKDWQRLVRHVMGQDLSWLHAAREYLGLCHKLVAERRNDAANGGER